MEALGDAVAFGEAPRADDSFVPVGEGFCQSDDGVEAARFEGVDQLEQLRDQLFCLARGDVFRSHEVIGFLHLIVNGFEGGVLVEETGGGFAFVRRIDFQDGCAGQREIPCDASRRERAGE